MTPDLAQIGMTLIVFGLVAVVALHGWWRNPTDHVTRALSAVRIALKSLFPKAPQA